jgi:hypothetical protein
MRNCICSYELSEDCWTFPGKPRGSRPTQGWRSSHEFLSSSVSSYESWKVHPSRPRCNIIMTYVESNNYRFSMHVTPHACRERMASLSEREKYWQFSPGFVMISNPRHIFVLHGAEVRRLDHLIRGIEEHDCRVESFGQTKVHRVVQLCVALVTDGNTRVRLRRLRASDV